MVALLALTACGSGGDDSSDPEACGASPTPPIDPATEIVQLTPAQMGELCDWFSCISGGYGKQYTCGGNQAVYTQPDQTSCIDTITRATCSATVAAVTDCFTSIEGDPCALLTSSKCDVFAECATPN
jgi:hypothetical protein